MATLKARLKRVIEPDDSIDNSSTLYYTFLDLTEPINGWTINNAVIMIDYTIMCFNNSMVSNSGAIRCTNLLTFDGTAVTNKTNWGSVDQLTGSADSHCRLWPCCTVGDMIDFPLLYGYNNPSRAVLTPNLSVNVGDNPVEELQISISNPSDWFYFRYYITFDIMLFENNV
jgi:hypothetical protein